MTASNMTDPSENCLTTGSSLKSQSKVIPSSKLFTNFMMHLRKVTSTTTTTTTTTTTSALRDPVNI